LFGPKNIFFHPCSFSAVDGSPEATPQQNGKSSYGRQLPGRPSGSPFKSGEPSSASKSHKTLSRSSTYPKRATNKDHSAKSDDDSDSEYNAVLPSHSGANLSTVRPTPSPIQRDFLKRHGGSAASSSSQMRSEERAGANGVLGGTPGSHNKVT
jgi:hypothetical protein